MTALSKSTSYIIKARTVYVYTRDTHYSPFTLRLGYFRGNVFFFFFIIFTLNLKDPPNRGYVVTITGKLYEKIG